MNFPTITDRDEWNYLNSLKDSDLVGSPNTPNQGYYARVLRHKYMDCHVRLTTTDFQILQPGISANKVTLTFKQQARQRIFDAISAAHSCAPITEKEWLKTLEESHLLPTKP